MYLFIYLKEGREGERERGGTGNGRMGRGRGRVGPQVKACPPELFSWRRRCNVYALTRKARLMALIAVLRRMGETVTCKFIFKNRKVYIANSYCSLVEKFC